MQQTETHRSFHLFFRERESERERERATQNDLSFITSLRDVTMSADAPYRDKLRQIWEKCVSGCKLWQFFFIPYQTCVVTLEQVAVAPSSSSSSFSLSMMAGTSFPSPSRMKLTLGSGGTDSQDSAETRLDFDLDLGFLRA